jgi:hypothetical protein
VFLTTELGVLALGHSLIKDLLELFDDRKLLIDLMLEPLDSIVKNLSGCICQMASFSGIKGFDGEGVFGGGASGEFRRSSDGLLK